MYDVGYYVKKNRELAFKHYLNSANAGVSSAQFIMGYTYEVGLGVKQDYKKAEGWYLKAASQGDHKSIAAIKALTDDGLI